MCLLSLSVRALCHFLNILCERKRSRLLFLSDSHLWVFFFQRERLCYANLTSSVTLLWFWNTFWLKNKNKRLPALNGFQDNNCLCMLSSKEKWIFFLIVYFNLDFLGHLNSRNNLEENGSQTQSNHHIFVSNLCDESRV